MARKSPNRVVRAVTDALWRRDRRQMRAVNALMSVIEPKRRERATPSRRRGSKQR